MRKALAALGGATMLVAVSAASTLAAEEVPFKARLIQTAMATSCPVGTPAGTLCITQTATGTATHLGQVTKDSSIVLTFTSPTCGTFVEHTTFTGASGDTVTMIQTGTACFTSPTTVTATATYSVTGGTGRFSGATGGGTASAAPSEVSPGVLVGPATYTGVLSSAGSL